MKIVCIGRNYSEHAKELGNAVPSEPVIFMKPGSAILNNNKPFFIPEFSSDIHYELELVIKISKNGKHIEQQFANRYYSQIGLGIDFTARDMQDQLKSKGLPWEKAKAFDGSAVISDFVSLDSLKSPESIAFHLEKNDQRVQTGNSKDMLFGFDQILVEVSKYFTLTLGDLIFTGTPAGVGPVASGDVLRGFLEDNLFIDMSVR